MPGDVDGGVYQRGGEDRAGLAPGPAVEKAGDGREDDVAPVGEAAVGDVREAEEHGGRPPAGKLALRRARKHVLEQATKKKFFGPRGEEQNAERYERKGTPRAPARRELDEVQAFAERNANAAKHDEAAENVQAPTRAPGNRVADAVHAAQKHERGQRNGNAEQHGENVRETAARVRPEPL